MKRNHPHSQNLSSEKLDLVNNFEEHPIMQWLTQHWQKLLYGLFGGFALLFLFYLWSSAGTSKAASDYYNANQDFQAFQKPLLDPKAQNEAYQKLVPLLQRYPNLHSKYDGLIAQTLINRQNISEAMPYGLSTLKRVNKDHLPLYIEYSEITLLAAQNNLDEALNRSIALKQQMLDNAAKTEQNSEHREFQSSLFAFNLLRITLLQQELGLDDEEAQSWEEWKQYSGLSGNSALTSAIDNKGFFTVANILSEGQVSLDNYIDSRLKKLGKSTMHG